MKLGLAQNIQWPEDTDQPSQIKNAIEQVVLAERLGFDSAYFVEHHWTRHGILPSTLALLCYIAARTSRIRLGSAVLVLPFHNPARLVEDASMADILSDRRLELGVGRGFQWAEFNGFDMALEESTARFDEALDFIIRAWTEPGPASQAEPTVAAGSRLLLSTPCTRYSRRPFNTPSTGRCWCVIRQHRSSRADSNAGQSSPLTSSTSADC